MSFSSEIKEELSKTNNLKNKEEVKYEFLGYLISSNIAIKKNKIEYSTENEYNINRLNKLLNNLNIDYDICVKGNLFVIKFNIENITDYINLLGNIEKENLKKAFIRGSFLGSGSINDPNKKYHIEISLGNKQYANILKNILNEFDITFKELERKSSYSLYSKDGEEISKFLALIGASKAVINFEEIRVIRDIRNNVNRKVNCETANLNKTLNAALKQIENIKYLKQIGQFDKMPEQLQEIANLRLENPEASLVEIGQMLSKPIGKSGVNHRFYNIEQFVSKFRQ